jgi:RNA polymerase sigma factor (TIGR02999 family)
MRDATVLMAAAKAGEPKAVDQLLELVYENLRELAARKLAHELPGQTLQPTALVHEAWLRLVGSENPNFENQAHFFAAAAEAMRRILIERARRRMSLRRGGKYKVIDIENLDLAGPQADAELLAVHEALNEFSKDHSVQAQVVKLRYFGGRTNEEIARILGVSVTTVKKYWAFSRAWLLQHIQRG